MYRFSERHRVQGPPIWQRLSAQYVENAYGRAQWEARLALGFDDEGEGDVRAALLERPGIARLEAMDVHERVDLITRGDAVLLEVPTPDGHGDVTFPADDEAMRKVKDLAVGMVRELRIQEWQAVGYLLSDVVPAMPWIDVETLHGPMGFGFTIYVGSQDVTAEDVRAAYAAAVRERLGAGESDRAPRADEVELFLHEIEQRRKGQSWRQAWIAWGPKAQRLGVNAYDTTEGKTTYRNKVMSLERRFPWMREFLQDAGDRDSKDYTQKGGETTNG